MNRNLDRGQWALILGSVLGVAVSVIPVGIISFSVFIKPLALVFSWKRAQISLALTVMLLAMAGTMPIAGRIIDRFGTRRPMLASLMLFALGLAGTPAAIGHFGIAGLYVAAVCIGILGSASSSVAYVKLLSARFDAHRGLALGFAMSGIAVGGATAPLTAASLIAHFGWQAGFYGLAALPILVGLPIAWLLPETAGVAAASSHPIAKPPGAAREELAAHEAMRGRTFMLLLLIFLLDAIAVHGVQLHIAPLLSDRGLSAQASAAGLSYLFIVSAFVRLLSGYLFDRTFAPWVGATCFCISALGMLMLSSQSTTSTMLIAVALLGVGAGAEADLLGFLVGRYFGMRSFGVIYGWVFAAFLLGSAIGPYLLGAAFDVLGNYNRALYFCAATLIIVTTLLLLLPQFPSFRISSDNLVSAASVDYSHSHNDKGQP